MPSQHLPHSHERCRVWREEQAASAWASAVQAACPSAPLSMSGLSAVPAPPMCTHTPTHTHQSLYTCRTHIPKHAQHATAGRQAASCSPHLLPFRAPLSLSQPPMHNFRSQAGARLSAASARSGVLTPPSYTLPHGHSTMRHAPSLAHACLTAKVQRGEGGALGHALRCQHSKALGAHATICPTTPRQHKQKDEERLLSCALSLSCDLSFLLHLSPRQYTHTWRT